MPASASPTAPAAPAIGPLRADRRRSLLLAGFVLLVVWSAAGLLIWQSRQASIDEWKRAAARTSLIASAYVGQALGAADLVLKSMLDWLRDEQIGNEAEFQAAVSGRRFYNEMRERIAGLRQIGMAGVVGRDGVILNATSSFPPPQASMAGREGFVAAISPNPPEVILTTTIPGRVIGRPTFFLLRPVVGPGGDVLGVLAIGLDARYLGDFFRQIAVSADSTISIMRDDGTLLASSMRDDSLLGRRFPDSLSLRLLREIGPAPAVFTDAPLARDPSLHLPRIMAPRRIEGFPAIVTLSIGPSVFLKPWRETSAEFVLAATLLSLATLLVLLRVLRLMRLSDAARRAASEQALLAAIVDTPSALTAVLDRAGRVMRANTRFNELFGERFDLYRSGDADDGFSEVQGLGQLRDFVAGNKRQAEIDLEVVRRGQPTCRLHFALARQTHSETGECIILVGQDVTLRHQAQRAIAQTAKLATLGEVTTGIAHELSQPLNVIRMAAQNALAELEPEPEDEDDTPGEDASADGAACPPPIEPEFKAFLAGKLHRVIAQVDRAAAIINRMRIFSRTSREGPQPVDMREACHGALALMTAQLRRDGIAVHLQLDEAPVLVVGNMVVMQQVIVSLLANARDALRDSPSAGKAIAIRALRSADGRVIVRIADNGPGVPTAIRDRIFEPFFTTKPVGDRSGLGLATSYGLVRDAGGTLALAEPEPGELQGAVFRIDLPAAVQTADADKLGADRTPDAPPPPTMAAL
ncbi:MAG: ATP-binding protein [Reyranella sp.]|uniref:ATP-binding protein n=1 Tax=Reyranella sp. TaxID=1929291 RepID=UPI003D12E3CD